MTTLKGMDVNTAMNKPYPLPDPRVRPDSFLTIIYKTMKRIEFDDRAWDKIYFARSNKRMAELLEILDDDVQVAVRCIQELKDRFESEMGVDWTIETVIKYSFEWKSENQRKTDRDCMKRLLGEFSKDQQIGELKRPDVIGLLERIKLLPPPVDEKKAISK